MPITHFQITEIPPDFLIISKYDNNALPINTNILIANQNLITFERTAAFATRAVKAKFKYRILDLPNNRFSNVADATLIFPPELFELNSENVENTILNADEYDLFDILPLSDAVERVQIKSIDGAGQLLFNNQPVFTDQIFQTFELVNLNFKPFVTGGGTPYFLITYLVGNNSTFELTIYELKTNIASFANLLFINDSVFYETETFDNVLYNVKTHESSILINNGQVFKNAQIEVIITAPFLALNANSKIFINVNSDEFEYTSNQTINFNVLLNNLGQANINVSKYIVYDIEDTDTEGTIDVNLLSIDNDVNLVNLPQNYQITVYQIPGP